MNRDQENFEELRRLLVLKRYEVPPPGYFDHFSRSVVGRIKAGEGARVGFFERLSWEAPWLQRFWSVVEGKPALAGVFGVAVCGLLVSGVVYSESSDATPVAAFGQNQGLTASMDIADNSSGLSAPAVLPAGFSAPAAGGASSLISPAGHNPGSLFNNIKHDTERAGFLQFQR